MLFSYRVLNVEGGIDSQAMFRLPTPAGRLRFATASKLLAHRSNLGFASRPLAAPLKKPAEAGIFNGVPKGIRTPVAGVKGRSPRPLDDGDNKRARIVPDVRIRSTCVASGGARRDRTADLYTASVALSQLSYSPSREARKVIRMA